jgi:ankyrin repeat protein
MEYSNDIEMASYFGNYAVVKSIIQKKGGDLSKSKERPLNMAVMMGHLDVVKLLIEHGAKVNQTSNYSTPLSMAVRSNYKEIAEYLLENGASVNPIDNSCESALEVACGRNDLEMVKQLVERGADVNFVTHSQISPARTASGLGYLEILKYLHSHGASINSLDEVISPLYSASLGKQFETVKWLIEHDSAIVWETGLISQALCTPWKPSIHHLYSQKTRDTIKLSLLVWMKPNTNMAKLPKELLLFHIIPFVASRNRIISTDKNEFRKTTLLNK